MSPTITCLLNCWRMLYNYNDNYEDIYHFLSPYLKASGPVTAYLHTDSCHLPNNVRRWVFSSQSLEMVNLWLWGSVNLSVVSQHINGKIRIWTQASLSPKGLYMTVVAFKLFLAMKSVVSGKSYMEACHTAKVRIDLCLAQLQNYCSTLDWFHHRRPKSEAWVNP